MSAAEVPQGDAELGFRFGGFETRVLFTGPERWLEPAAGRPNSPVCGSPGSAGQPGAAGPALFVVDQGFVRLHRRLLDRLGEAAVFTVAAGEKAKSWNRARDILRAARACGLDRDGTIAGIGGGVVCDLAAFCASVYMRGCRLVLAPTTLLAMVDAALGGKTGVNFEGFKNLVGTFYPAAEIRIWVGALDSLPDRELLSGLAEALKSALVGDEGLWSLLESRREALLRREPELLAEVVRRCLVVKGSVVEEDFRENGRRAILNLGHTFAHALEAASGLGAWSHGEAVAWGIARAARLGELLGVTPPEHAARIRKLLGAYGYRIAAGAGVDPRRLVAAMRADKKRREGKLLLVLQRGIGDTVVQAVEEARIIESLESD